MSQSTRLRDIVAILEARRQPVPIEFFLNELEISRAAFKRDLAVLRDQMQAPIVWKRAVGDSQGGYVLEDKGWSSGKLGLPNAWFTSSEIYALLMIEEFASHIGPGLLTEHLNPLISRISIALSAADDSPQVIRSKVKILASASKRHKTPFFEVIARATIKELRVHILYFTRSKNVRSERLVSPHRLIHYKENWYLIAWCHIADGLRVFSLDAVENAFIKNESILKVDSTKVDELIGKDFGIYSGADRKWAKLKFTSIQASWVKDEIWHAEQKMSALSDGSLILEIPYANDKEISLEILKFGADVEVLEPPELRKSIRSRLSLALAQYENIEN